MSDSEMVDVNSVFDPDQDPTKKRVVRQKLRALQGNIDNRQHSEISAKELIGVVGQSNDLFHSGVKGVSEAILESGILAKTSGLGLQKAKAMKSGSGAFDIDDFVSKLVSFMGGNKMEDQLPDDSDAEVEEDTHSPLNWDRIGRRAMEHSRRIPVLGFMLGPLVVEQKKRGPVKRSKLEKNKEDERKPQELKEEDIQRSANETTKNVAVLESILRVSGEINLFMFVINPNDFAQSVENIFYLSFLIRDGKVAFETRDGEPLIYLCDQPTDKDYDAGLKKQQMVVEFDMATWKRAIKVFQIRDSMIPQREKAATKLGNKWIG